MAVQGGLTDLKNLTDHKISFWQWAAISAAGAGGASQFFAKDPRHGVATASRNPTSPWNVVYGRARVGGSTIFINTFGDNDKYLDLVMILAAHPCQSVDALRIDNKTVQVGSIHTTPHGWAGVTFTPLQQDITIRDIRRSGNVITVCLLTDIPLLKDGDHVKITSDHSGGILDTYKWTGEFPVTIVGRGITSPNIGGATAALIFTYLCGGDNDPTHLGPVDFEGGVKTTWPDYKSKIYVEVMLGGQTLGETFQGMINGTPYDGDWTNLQTNNSNPWTANCSCVGMTAVFLRLHFNDQVLNSLPQISFLVSGKNNVYDPRTSPPSYVYTDNAALCIADYYSNPIWGFSGTYGGNINVANVISEANICDEAVTLANGNTESRYTCNGSFTLDRTPGTILEELYTSCAGRPLWIGGQFLINSGVWRGISHIIGNASPPSAADGTIYGLLTGEIQWKPAQPANQLFNGVKGTYVSDANNWQPSDFPAYAQDTYHGYSWGTGPLHDANLDADGGRRWLNIQLPFTLSPSMAQRIAKILLLRKRQLGSGKFSFDSSQYAITPLDNLAVSLPYFGWAGKYLEVQAVDRVFQNPQAQGGSSNVPIVGIDVEVQETDSSVYAWEVAEELSPQGYQQAIIPDMRTPSPPTDFLATSENGTIFLSWTVPSDGFVLNGGHIEIEYQLVASPEGLWISLARMDPRISTAIIPNLVIGTSYNIQIRSVNAAGVPSDWQTVAPAASSPLTPGPITVLPPVIWVPNFVTPVSGDPIFSAKGFGIDQSYQVDSSGAPLAQLQIYGDPPPSGKTLVFKVRRELVSGINAQVAASVTEVSPVDGIHGVIAFGGSGITPDIFAGRILSQLSKPLGDSGQVPINDFVIDSNDANGNFTVHPDPVAAGCQAGDLFTVRTAPTSSTPSSFTDTLFDNFYNVGGLTAHGNAGNLAIIVANTGAGQVRTVTDNTLDTVNVSPNWDVLPDATSIIKLVEAIPQAPTPANTAVPNSASLVGNVGVNNYLKQVVHVEAYTSDEHGLMGPIQDVPFRELYIWGSQGTRVVTASGTELAIDGTVKFDSSAGPITFQCLSANQHLNSEIFYVKVSTDSNVVTVVAASGEAFTDGSLSFTLLNAGDSQPIKWHG